MDNTRVSSNFRHGAINNGVGDPADTSLSNQTTLEAFWRFQLTQQIALTPSVQYLKNPVGDPNEDTVWLWGLRFRFTY